ncbi:MAG: hypothetical protein QW507_03555, partial [Candidatus Nanoarchaeia archaeon]|nr:hypothetical protein [Candidatus Haiyanarchaeum thermophilum]MCW1306925.1 hypothetical protein [Candidatus Haiyanarchaeum thermophilum]MCW1308338.1 hypothetical protein [Candidatus Haiyanarchaeum thermophilum]MCW1309048.1 hypothetical protein [Candidatus Haiyanarchaeum thermophilum]
GAKLHVSGGDIYVDSGYGLRSSTGDLIIDAHATGYGVVRMYDDVIVSGNLYVGGTANIRPLIRYTSTAVDYEISTEGQWIDDPFMQLTVTISGPTTLWIVYRGRVYAKDEGTCGNAHSYGYSKINVDGTDYEVSEFAWEVSTAEGGSGERGFISTLLIDVFCTSYPCSKTIKGRVYVKDGTCPCIWPLYCDVRQHLAQRNLFVEGFRL